MPLTAAANAAFRLTAELHLNGQADELWVTQQVDQIVVHADYDRLPLGYLYGLEDEWEGGWGRPVDELRADVHQRCAEQAHTA